MGMLKYIQDLLKPMQSNKGNLSLSFLAYSFTIDKPYRGKKYMVVALEYI